MVIRPYISHGNIVFEIIDIATVFKTMKNNNNYDTDVLPELVTDKVPMVESALCYI